MKKRTIVTMIVLAISIIFFPVLSHAQQEEPPCVSCGEENEPIQISYGEHTCNCNISPVTDVDTFHCQRRAGNESCSMLADS